MMTGTNISQFRSWLNDAPADELVTIAPLLFSRIGTLDQRHQEQFIDKIQSNPEAKSVFKKFQAAS